MKLCLLANAASIHTRRWATYFSEHGHDVTVLSLSAGSIPGVRVIRVGAEPPKIGRLAYLLAVPRVRRTIRQLRPDVVHAHYAGGYGLVGALSGFHPLVISAWGSDVLVVPRTEPIMKWLIRKCLDRADLITSVAEHMSVSMRAMGIAGRILTLTYGADTEVFRPRPESIWTSSGLIVSTRHMEPIYNVGALVEALPEIIAVVPSVRAVLIGDGSMRKQLEERTRELGLESHVEFKGRLTETEVAAWLSKADIYVSTSLSDGNSISLHEAMACGAFPVVSNIPANREWIDDGCNGFLVNAHDPADLAGKIVAGIRGSELRRTAAGLNRELACKKGSWKNSMGKMEEEYLAIARFAVYKH